MRNKETEPTFTASKKKKYLLFGLLSTALILLLAVLAYVYWYQAPNRVVSDALFNAATAHSAVYKGSASSTGTTNMTAALNGGVSADGATINADFTFNAAGKKYSLGGNGLVDSNGDAYVKVQNIDSLVGNYRRAIPENSQTLFDQIIARIDDKWIKVSAADIQGYSTSVAKLQKCVSEVTNKIQSDDAQRSELVAVYKQHPFVVIDKSLGAKNGSLGYLVSINENTSRAFDAEFKRTRLYKSLSACYAGLESSASITTVAPPQLEVWISRWTHTITSLTLRDESNGQTTTITVEPIFNRSVTIAAPKSATTLQQLQKDVQALLSSSQTVQSTAPAPTP